MFEGGPPVVSVSPKATPAIHPASVGDWPDVGRAGISFAESTKRSRITSFLAQPGPCTGAGSYAGFKKMPVPGRNRISHKDTMDEGQPLLQIPPDIYVKMKGTTLGKVRAYWLGSVVCMGGFLFGYDSGM